MAPKQKEPYKLKLPAQLVDEIGQSDHHSGYHDSSLSVQRLQTRKAERSQRKLVGRPANSTRIRNFEHPNHQIEENDSADEPKRSHRQNRHRPGRKREKKLRKRAQEETEETDFDLEEPDDKSEDDEPENKKPASVKARKQSRDIPDQPKSILKRTKQPDKDVPARNGLRSPTPPLSRAVTKKLEEEDARIAELEKRLGIKSKKLPQSFKDDGLDDLLAGIDDLVGLGDESDEDIKGKKRKRTEDEEWLANKRKKAGKVPEAEDSEDESGSGDDIGGGLDLDEISDDFPEDEDLEGDSTEDDELEEDDNFEGDEAIEDDDDEFEGFDSESTPPPEKRVRENPYVAPSTGIDQSAAKYVPPSLRKPAASDSEELIRLRRQLQGLVNRLTDANLISILADVEKIYRTNARQHVTSTLVDLLLTSVCEPTSLPDTLIILPAGFIAAVYKVIGTDFGAQVIQRIVELFDQHYQNAAELGNDGPEAATFEGRKETANLITLLSELYNFQVVGSVLIFDYIRQFLSKLSELNTELLLRVIKVSGPQLRQDDPSSLKDIVAMLRPAIASVGEANLSVRTKFMIETINNLKNNKMKTGAAASAVVSEHTIRMKKTIGSLNTRSIKAYEPLRISLKDIQDSDKKGKWWLVGASWAGNDTKTTGSELASTKSSTSSKIKVKDIDNDLGSTDLIQMAREHRMNTDIRRSIFITILSASDYKDAHHRLLKLKLKKSQEIEIPKVLLHCAGGEKAYNPYYTLIAKQLCQGDRKLKMSFQFSCWDLFKRMGASDDEEDDGDEEDQLELREVVNLAKFFGNLIASNSQPITILKKLRLSQLRDKIKIFVEILLITLFLEIGKGRDEAVVKGVFEKVKEVEGLGVGIAWFLRKVVARSDVVSGEEREVVKWGCDVARRVLSESSEA